MKIKKRDSTIVAYSDNKVYSAIKRSYLEVSKEDVVPPEVEDTLQRIVKQARNIARGYSRRKSGLAVELLQDSIEKLLMSCDYKHDTEVWLNVAKTYILYREARNKARRVRVADTKQGLVDFKFMQAYAKYSKKDKRRETYEEACSRVEAMHISKFRNTALPVKYITNAFNAVKAKQVLPSMRSMQFGGKAVLDNNLRLYNCSATVIDAPDKFAKILYLLLCGCGVGWDVGFEWVDKLSSLVPELNTSKINHVVVDDSIEGWGDAIEALIASYFSTGIYTEFSYHKIRQQGTPLKTSGGKAPGHLGLKQSIEHIRTILNSRLGRKLRPIDCHDVCCRLSDAVLSGGIRRSAGICLFSPDDLDMITAKTGNWFEENPQRARANNSCKLIHNKCTKEQVEQLFKRMIEFGEPGIYFAPSMEVVTNPCAEISINPILDGVSGFGVCNLTEVNCSDVTTQEELNARIIQAAVIGTLQAAYTNFPYIGQTSVDIAKKEALLGVSLTGIMDSKALMLLPKVLEEAAKLAVETNAEVAKLIGINPAKRVTTVKPSGTASIILGCVSNGIHPQHSRRYFRRVQINREDPIYKHFHGINPHMCERSSWSSSGADDIITFCVEAPESSILREDIGAIDALKTVIKVKKHWINTGIKDGETLSHNISNTITVKEDEWAEVTKFVWEHRTQLAGVSFLGYFNDKGVQMPFEAVTTEEDEQHWNYLSSNYTPVDYTKLIETEDNTNLKDIVACSGGACSLI